MLFFFCHSGSFIFKWGRTFDVKTKVDFEKVISERKRIKASKSTELN